MKIFYNHDNGFNYDGRIFCEVSCLPEKESDDELLNEGWLPSMEDYGIWYQSRSCRLNMDEFYISTKRKYIINKLKIKNVNYEKDNFIDNFFENYYIERGFDIFDLYTNCSNFFKISVIQVEYKNEIVGYARFTERDESNIFLNLSYSKKYPKLSLGTNLFFILSEYTKTQNKKYLYIYESYKDVYEYKESFTNVEIWNGTKWMTKNGKG